MTKKILIQLDTDPHPSSFDGVVAVDADVDCLMQYAGVRPEDVERIVHGAMFTRGPNELANTALFIGGSNVTAGERVLSRVLQTFFGPVRVSVMMDSNGSNTTAAAAVLSARRHLNLPNVQALVLGGTGPVGLRAAQLLAAQGAAVRVGSRSIDRARQACDTIVEAVPDARATPCATESPDELPATCHDVSLVIAAGAAGAGLLPEEVRRAMSTLRVAIDLNAVPPAGISGLAVTDKGVERDGVICYGAIGVGGLKMKIHKQSLKRLFEANDLVLDTSAIYAIGEGLV